MMTHNKALIKKFFCIVSLLHIFFGQGCVSVSDSPSYSMSRDQLPQYWLTTSMYAGRFYDSDQLNLIDYRPFSAIDDVETLDGFILYPKKTSTTVKAGTLVKILEISYPDKDNSFKRPLYSPRDQIWVYLKVAKERGKVSLFHETPYILVAPRSITTEKQLRGFLARFLSDKDPNQWILTLPSHMQNGIFEKRPVIGMKREHVLSTLGPATKKQFQKKDDYEEAQEIWHYPNYFIIFADDAVKTIKQLN